MPMGRTYYPIKKVEKCQFQVSTISNVLATKITLCTFQFDEQIKNIKILIEKNALFKKILVTEIDSAKQLNMHYSHCFVYFIFKAFR